jgi:hypothetical protein
MGKRKIKRKRAKVAGQHVTSLALPTALWRSVRMLALREGVTARELMVGALERLVAQAGKE